MKAFAIVAALLLGIFLAPSQAGAQTCSASITDVDFGRPNLLSAEPTDTLANLTVTCTRIPFFTVVKICPGIGEGSGGSSGSARLVRSAATGRSLAYQLYQDSNRTQGWGAIDETQLGTIPAIILGGGFTTTATATLTIYARLFGSQSAPPASDYRSTFAGSETFFSYAPFFLGATSSCAGFVGTATIRPSFDVVAQPAPYCSVSSSDLDFGAVGVIESAIRAQSSVRVSCTQRTPYSISLDGGQANAIPTTRRLTSSGGASITYGLYRNSTRSLPWGAEASTRIAATGTGTEQSFIVYGQVPAQRTPRPGTYSDRIVVTIVY